MLSFSGLLIAELSAIPYVTLRALQFEALTVKIANFSDVTLFKERHIIFSSCSNDNYYVVRRCSNRFENRSRGGAFNY